MTDGLKQPVLSVPPNQLRETHVSSQFDTELASSAWHLIADDNDSLIADDEALDEQLELYSTREKRFGSGTMRVSCERCLLRQRDLALAIDARDRARPPNPAMLCTIMKEYEISCCSGSTTARKKMTHLVSSLWRQKKHSPLRDVCCM